MIYIVLGMHKSGTSLISQTLHESGISMGENFRGEVRPKYEDVDVVNINKMMMEYVGIPYSGAITNKTSSRFGRIICRYKDNKPQDWGFKDPRTILTWNIWEDELDEYKIIGIYRNPIAVAHHWGDNIRYHIQQWINYNNKLLDIIKDKKYLLINFDEFVQSNNIECLQDFVGIPIKNCIDPHKVHRKRSEVPDYCKEIWDRLVEADNYDYSTISR